MTFPNLKLSLGVGSYRLSENSINHWNWSAPRYAFKYRFEMGVSTMFLPINPENLAITTSYATNLIPTLYGTIEEHSPTRYFNITISGTTGIAPTGPKLPDAGRVDQKYKDEMMAGRDKTPLDDGQDDIGVYPHQSGYIAFHSLYRFLMRYKHDAATNNRNEPLYFFNYKDNNVYRVSLNYFQMNRAAEDPFMYRYVITMTGYSISSIDKVEQITDTMESVLTNTKGLEKYGNLIKGSNSIFKDVYKTTRLRF